MPPSTRSNQKGKFRPENSVWARIIIDVHDWVNCNRAQRGLDIWDFPEGSYSVISECCEKCKEAGHANIIAHYKSVPEAMSHTGKRIPALCWDHKNNFTPRYMQKNPERDDTVVRETMSKEEKFADTDEPFNIDIDKAFELYAKYDSWLRVSKEMGIAYHRVLHATKKRRREVSPTDRFGKVIKVVTYDKEQAMKPTVIQNVDKMKPLVREPMVAKTNTEVREELKLPTLPTNSKNTIQIEVTEDMLDKFIYNWARSLLLEDKIELLKRFMISDSVKDATEREGT